MLFGIYNNWGSKGDRKEEVNLDIIKMKALSYDELRALYRNFLHSQNISKLTINTAYVDTFYLWR